MAALRGIQARPARRCGPPAAPLWAPLRPALPRRRPPPPRAAPASAGAAPAAAAPAAAAPADAPSAFAELAAGSARKYIMVSGKGGVGKTSLSASLALRLAAAGHTTLIVSTDPAHSLSDSLDQSVAGGRPVLLQGSDLPLWGMEVDPEEGRREFAAFSAANNSAGQAADFLKGFGLGAVADALAELRLGELLDTPPPGLDEAVAISKVVQFVESAEYARFSRIVFDTAPTGHTLRLLALPEFVDASLEKVIRLRRKLGAAADAVRGLFGAREPQDGIIAQLEAMRARVRGAAELFRDAGQTEFVIATVPTVLGINESSRLAAALRADRVPCKRLVVNQLIGERSGEAFLKLRLKDQAAALKLLGDDPALQGLQQVRGPLIDLEVRGVPALTYFGGVVWRDEVLAGLDAPIEPAAPAAGAAAGGAASAEGKAAAGGAGKAASAAGKDAAGSGGAAAAAAGGAAASGAAAAGASTSGGGGGASSVRAGRRFYMLGGKGGVGKTSCSAALGTRLAGQGHATLIVSTDPAHSLSDAFDQDLSGGGPVRIAPPPGADPDSLPLWGMQIDLDASRAELRAALGGGGGGGKSFDDFLGGLGLGGFAAQLRELSLGELMDTPPPGVDEAIAIAKVVQFLRADDYAHFDRIVFDTAPTGHTLRLLTLPDFLDKGLGKLIRLRAKLTGAAGAVKSLFTGGVVEEDPAVAAMNDLRARMDEARALFHDDSCMRFAVVTIPTVMAAAESARLAAALRTEGIPINTLVINQVVDPAAGERFLGLRRADQRRALDLVAADPELSRLQLIKAPLLDLEVRGASALEYFGRIVWHD
ncbi:ATPase [Raphidocelis subcapitata]|uniref:ATPase n=1 Tax=Raphidocelis subcapitata TaxID=307507 RepID=A0A2V0P1Y4_9CHLO|nr:ATPase [Raphidocelis subcapitata]|eukprot:GBF93888.1 ATPase [Raphidocelis subcapitata]